MALGHGVMPHLHIALDSLEATAVPKAIRDEIRQHFRDNARRNLFRAGELLQLLRLFDAHGIRAVPLKGPVLAVSAYGSLSMRQFTDLDLLIPKQAFARAEPLLRSRGYEVRLRSDTSISMSRPDEPCPVVVDLQWALADDRYSFPLSEEQLGQRLRAVAFMNTTVWQPAIDDQLLMLCAHPAKHCWSRLEWVSDVAAFVRSHSDQIDWQAVVARAGALGVHRLLLLALQLAHDCLRLELPAEVVASRKRDRVVGDLAREVSERLLDSSNGLNRLNGSYGVVEAGVLYIRTRERVADKLAYVRYLARLFRQWCGVAPNEQDRAVIALPRFLDGLYFVIRPLRLLYKYGARALKCGADLAASWR
jgi:hypothetical protein